MSDRHRTAVTLLEVMVAALVLAAVLAIAMGLFLNTMKASRRAQDASSVVQMAALLYRAMDLDLQNLAPVTRAEAMVQLDPVTRPGETRLEFRRFAPRSLLVAVDPRELEDAPLVQVVGYRARLGAAGLYRIWRQEASSAPELFDGVLAAEVLFQVLDDGGGGVAYTGRTFVRVRALLVAPPTPAGPPPDASRCLLTGLWTVPLARAARR